MSLQEDSINWDGTGGRQTERLSVNPIKAEISASIWEPAIPDAPREQKPLRMSLTGPWLSEKKGVELKTNCRVREITLNSQGMADGVIYYDAEGRENLQKAEVVILACNAVGTPRLLLNSSSSQFPDGLANHSGLVGKNLMLHPWGKVVGYFKEGSNFQIGPVMNGITSHEFSETNPDLDFVRGTPSPSLRHLGPQPRPLLLERKYPGDLNIMRCSINILAPAS